MADIIQAVRGMNDILPSDNAHWQYLENILRQLAASYGYSEIRTPIVEHTELFKRAVGEVTDVVEKEMYTFVEKVDRDDRKASPKEVSLTLRPEGTAGVVRAGIEHGLFHNQIQKLWYISPIFRHERPQRGRYRQFYQFGLEAIGMSDPAVDAELLLFTARLWKQLGLENEITLEINTLGTPDSRAAYRTVLIKYFETHKEALDEDSERRLYKNPLRILDSKNPSMQALIEAAPKMQSYLDEVSTQHFQRLQEILMQNNIAFVVNPRLVRGLDYYTDTVFEWVTTSLGAQGTVSAGGRYDGLIAQIGGKATPAVGFAMGIERIIELLKTKTSAESLQKNPDICMLMFGDAAVSSGLMLAEQCRNAIPELKITTNLAGGSFKSQFKKADKSGAGLALIIGDEELSHHSVAIKFLREDKPQETILQTDLIEFLKKTIRR